MSSISTKTTQIGHAKHEPASSTETANLNHIIQPTSTSNTHYVNKTDHTLVQSTLTRIDRTTTNMNSKETTQIMRMIERSTAAQSTQIPTYISPNMGTLTHIFTAEATREPENSSTSINGSNTINAPGGREPGDEGNNIFSKAFKLSHYF